MDNQNQRSEELFDTINKNKKRKKRKVIYTVLIIIAVVAAILIGAVSYLRKRVTDRFASNTAEVKTYSVDTGTIQTLISGSGTLTQVDLEAITVPAGVEITEVTVKRNQTVSKGDLLATVDMSSVMTALSDLQSELNNLDNEIADAKGNEVSSSITAGIAGRVKRIFAQSGTDVSVCMAENGALAVLSLDGYMAVRIDTDTLQKNDTITVVRTNGTEIKGTVESVANGSAVILVTDNGPEYDEAVTVMDSEDQVLGSGNLYIHKPLSVTGYAGTVSAVSVKENQNVHASTTLFRLKNTSFSANYDTLLRERNELEEELLALLTIYRDGAVLAPMDGIISSVDYTESSSSTVLYTTTTDTSSETNLVTLYPNISMSITIGIDETDILSLSEGQEAKIEVSSVSDQTFKGIVTEINTEASTTSGVTQYSAVVTFDRAEGMMAGMTASVYVTIEGVENAKIIPVDALHQTSAIYYVYTSYDEATKQYGGMTEVTIGMQNDSYVEILSGLELGDTVYYTEKETFSFNFGSFGGMGGIGGMSGMGGMGGSGMGGGNMPSGMPNMGGSGNRNNGGSFNPSGSGNFGRGG